MESTFTLENVSVARAIDGLHAALFAMGLSSQDVARHTLTAEEVLLTWQEQLGTATPCCLGVKRRFSRLHIRLRCAGAAVNPLPPGGEDEADDILNSFGYTLLLRLGAKAQYAYSNGVNEVSLTVSRPRKGSPILSLLGHVAAGVVLGLLLQLFPWGPALAVNKEVIVPLLKAFSSFLCGILPFVVFFSICCSIVDLTSLRNFYSMAGKVVSRFLGLNFLGGALMALICALVLPLSLTAEMHGGGFWAALWGMLLDLFPPNLTEPFSTGNIPQVVVLAFMCGSVMLLLEAQIKPLKEQVQNISLLLVSALGVLTKCIPLFVMGTIIQCFFIEMSSVLSTAFNALALGLVVIPLFSMVCFWTAAWRSGRAPLLAFRQGLPAIIVAFCTMSSAASFSELLQNCKECLRLPEKLCNFGVPVALVLNKMSTSVSMTLVTVTCAIVFGVDLSLESLCTLTVQAALVSIAAPPVAGGTLLVYAVLFKQCGIPEEALGLTAVFVLALDGVVTASRAMVTQAVLIDVAGAERGGGTEAAPESTQGQHEG